MVFVKIWKFKNRLEEVCGDILCSKNAILNKKMHNTLYYLT